MIADRELLELAARAAGIDHGADRLDSGLSLTLPNGRHRSLPRWNPLGDDGDALRLAVQCGLEVSFVDDEPDRKGRNVRACAGFPASTERPCRIRYVFEDHNGDIFVATRRAIVRAAAEIAKEAA